MGCAGLANAQLAPPPNDRFANAQPVSGSAGSMKGNNTFATREIGEPNHAGSTSGHSVWYRWVAPRGGLTGFSTVGSSFDTVLAVYTGSSLNALTTIASNNDRLGETSLVVFNAAAGKTYHVAVDGFNKPPLGDRGAVKLNWFPAPANDDFARAQEIRGPSGNIKGSNIGASKQPGEPNHASQAGGASVWYRWQAPASGIVTFNTTGSNFDTLLAIYSGAGINALSPVASNNNRFEHASSVTFKAAAGAVYHIAVDGVGGDFGDLHLNWSPPAANDDFADAQLISGSLGSLTDDNAGATRETGEPVHAGRTGGTSIWYRWTAPITGTFTFTTMGSEINTLLAVYTGAGVGALTAVASNNDDSRGRTTSIVTFNVGAGVTYRIAVDGFAGITGNLRLNWFRTPGNDLFADAQSLVGASGSVPGSNLAAFKEAGEPNHAGEPGGASVWYRWQAPVSGPVTFSTAGSSLNTLLAIHTGVSVNALTPVASGKGTVTFNATGGVMYRIAVDGQPDEIRNRIVRLGDFTLHWASASRPANDNFVNAQPLIGVAGSVTGSNERATEQTGEPNHGPLAAGASIWYRWTAPASGTFVFTTPGSDFNTVLAVYTGAGVNALTLIKRDVNSGPGESSVVVFNTTAGVTYRIAVDGRANVPPSTGNLKLNWSPSPANDYFANAQAIAGRGGSREGSTLGASKEDAEPFHAGDEGGASVWYRWTAPVSGPVSFATFGSNFNPLLAVYTGASIHPLATIARNDDRVGLESGVRFNATAGVTYRIAVDGRAGSSGAFTLQWSPSSIPANDDFADAQVLNGAGGKETGSNAGASRERFEPAHAGQAADSSVWYRWRAPAAGRAAFTTLGSDFSTRLAVYTGAGLAALTAVASSGSNGAVTFNVAAGMTYHIAVDGGRASDVDSQQGSLLLSFRMLPLTNDNFANAQPLEGSVGRREDDSLGATLEAGEPAHANTPDGASPISGGASLWYRWQAPSSGSTTFTTVGSSFDTLLAVYTGSSLDALSPIASNDNFVLGTSLVTFTAEAGTTYFIAVDGRLGQTGLVTLAWNRGAPANDNFAGAQTIGGPFSVDGATGGNNANATKEAGEPSHAGNPGGRSIWYRWQAPTTGAVTFSTAGSDLDTLLAVYTGNGPSTLTPVAGNDDDGQLLTSRVNFQTVAGATYLIAVDGLAGRAGDIILKWRVSSSISGRVVSQFVGISSDGIPFAPIIVTGTESRTLTADAAGFYTIANLPPNGSYTVTAFGPGKTAGIGWLVDSRSFSPLNGDLDDVELVVRRFIPSVSVSGRVKDAGDKGLPGITVVLSGSASLTRTTNSFGGYSLPNLPVGGSFVIAPTSPNYNFTPTHIALGNFAGDLIGGNFIAGEPFTISGKVTDHTGAPLGGVTITLIGSGHPPLETDADGNYSFIVPAGGNYTVAPVLDNFVFAPSNPTFANLSQHQKTVDFTGTRIITISGRVLLNGSGLGGVLVTLGGGATASAMTGADGGYAFPGLAAGLNYTVTPSKANFTFNPPSLVFDNPAGNQTGDFAATPPIVSIAAADAGASEPGADTGSFTVARSGNVDASLTIIYTIGGTATNGADYDEITSSVTIGAGAASTAIPIRPKDDALIEGNETVTLTLA
ncbi:MAG: carboxypeptidase regulatory-like domain-containing protein, partial [Pseudomonadota bacterium]